MREFERFCFWGMSPDFPKKMLISADNEPSAVITLPILAGAEHVGGWREDFDLLPTVSASKTADRI